MRIISDSVPRALAATAQVSLFGVGGATAVLALLSGWLYARFGPAGFWAMADILHAIPRHLPVRVLAAPRDCAMSLKVVPVPAAISGLLAHRGAAQQVVGRLNATACG
jgi:hypothetical protein